MCIRTIEMIVHWLTVQIIAIYLNASFLWNSESRMWPVLFTVIFPALCMYLDSHESSTDTCWMNESELYLFVYAHLYFFNLFHWGCILLQWERKNKFFFYVFVAIVLCVSHVQLFATPWTVCILPRFLVHGIFQAGILEWITIFPPSRPGTEPTSPGSPALQVDSLPAEP